jgi:hypothetical protein
MRVTSSRGGLVPSLLALVLLAVPLAQLPAPAAAAAPRTQAAANPYTNTSAWLCRPNVADVCDSGLDTTVIQADGSRSIERWAPAAAPPIDCFYVYPTVSTDLTPNSDRIPGPQERWVARVQAARLGSSCRVFAPVYRQVTSTWVTAAFFSFSALDLLPAQLVDIAYRDVVASFQQYLAADNRGRGVVLVGHSQGAALLSRLYDEVIRPDPALRARLVSAALMGLPPIERPDPSVLAPCTDPDQTGCLVSFSAFRSNRPPPEDSMFARSDDPRACSNPAALAGGRTPLHAYFPTSTHPWLRLGSWPITTPFVSVPGLLTGECVHRGEFTYLEVTVHGVPADPRADDIPGDLTPEWGLHLVDVQLVLGDLVELIGRQGRSYQQG